MTLVKLVEPSHHRFEIGSRLATIVEGAHALVARAGNARMVEIDMQFRLISGLADKKWLDEQRERAVTGVPAPVLDKQILAILEAEQGKGREAPIFEVAAEQDREFVLQAPELARDCHAGHVSVAEL